MCLCVCVSVCLEFTNFPFSSSSSFSFTYPNVLLWNSLILHPLQLSITQPIMDGFWCSRCLNDRIAVPEMMGSFSGGSTTPLVVKSGTEQAWWKVFFFLVQYMPHQNRSRAFVFQHIWKRLTLHGSMDPGQQLSHTKFSFQQLSSHKVLILKWPIFVVGTRGENRYFSNANYSINYNSKVLMLNILQIDICLSFQNLKKNLKSVHKRRS